MPEDLNAARNAPERMERMKPVLDRIPDEWGKYLPDPGWDELLLSLNETVSVLDPDYQILQAKEKFGTLRFYVSLSEEVPPHRRELIQSIISDVENLSAVVCEDCGAAGARSRDGGWIKTLCDDCAGGDGGGAV